MVGSQLSKAIAAVIRGRACGEGQPRKGGIKELELGCSVGPHGLSRIGTAIARGHSLTRLTLTGARIGDAGFKLLATGIRANPCISELVLSCCGLTDATAESIAAVLRSHASKLAVARWQTNLRGYESSTASASERGLGGDAHDAAFSREATAGAGVNPYSGATGLSLLDISNNMFTDASLAILCATLEQDELLTTFIVGGNLFSDQGRAALRAVEVSRVPRLEVEYDENDDDRTRERELARRRTFMASTIERIRSHSTPERPVSASAAHKIRPFAEANALEMGGDMSSAKRALSSRPRWSMAKPGSEQRPRVAKPVMERAPPPPQMRRKQASSSTPSSAQKKKHASQARSQPHLQPQKTKVKKERMRRKNNATSGEEKSLSVMMDDMTTLLARLETSVETLNKRKKKSKKDEADVHGSDEDENKATGDGASSSSAAVLDSDSIDRLNERLKKLYDISY